LKYLTLALTTSLFCLTGWAAENAGPGGGLRIGPRAEQPRQTERQSHQYVTSRPQGAGTPKGIPPTEPPARDDPRHELAQALGSNVHGGDYPRGGVVTNQPPPQPSYPGVNPYYREIPTLSLPLQLPTIDIVSTPGFQAATNPRIQTVYLGVPLPQAVPPPNYVPPQSRYITGGGQQP
jgi:hypothetical protein